MLTKKEASELVSAKLRERSPYNDLFVVIDRETIEKPFGWVFFYNSKRFVETGVFRYRLAGNGPVIVNKHDGTVEFLESRESPTDLIIEYERKLAARQQDG